LREKLNAQMVSVHLDAGSKKKKKQAKGSSVAASSSPAAPSKSRGKGSKAGKGNGKGKKAKKTNFDAEQLSDLDDAEDDDLISRIRQGPGAEQSTQARAGSDHSLGGDASPRPSNAESPSSPAAIGSGSATRAVEDSDDDMPQPSKRRRLVVDSDEE
jgi:hypothetical protein